MQMGHGRRVGSDDGSPRCLGEGSDGHSSRVSATKRKRRHYSEKQKRKIVRAYRASGQPQTVFCAEHAINVSALGRWLRSGDYDEGRARDRSTYSRRNYSPEERRNAVETYRTSGLSMAHFCRTWGVSTGSLKAWLTRYEEAGPQGLEPKERKKAGDGDKRKLPKPVKSAIVDEKESPRLRTSKGPGRTSSLSGNPSLRYLDLEDPEGARDSDAPETSAKTEASEQAAPSL